FILKSPPTSFLIKKAAGVERGAGNPATDTVGKLTRKQVREIAEVKFNDMNALDIEAAMKQVEGTCRNMGIEVVD
ncbi:MAG: 50S ribosomal protein L11, partial [Anaerolineae bacterium]|nr:50S ribosomal protein L11 [Anaerolineae bacterium]